MLFLSFFLLKQTRTPNKINRFDLILRDSTSDLLLNAVIKIFKIIYLKRLDSTQFKTEIESLCGERVCSIVDHCEILNTVVVVY